MEVILHSHNNLLEASLRVLTHIRVRHWPTLRNGPSNSNVVHCPDICDRQVVQLLQVLSYVQLVQLGRASEHYLVWREIRSNESEYYVGEIQFGSSYMVFVSILLLYNQI